MKRLERGIAALAIAGIAIALALYGPIKFNPIKRAFIYALEKRLDAKISCRSLKIRPGRYIVISGLDANGKGGFGLTAKEVRFNYNLVSLITGRLHIRCNLEEVNLYKTSTIIDSLSGMLQIESLGNVLFDVVQADLFVGTTNTLAHNLIFLSNKIKIFGDALTERDNTIMCNFLLLLKDDLISDIPDEIRSSLLKSEGDSWSSLHVGIMGNYKKPSLRIITDRFRMNITS